MTQNCINNLTDICQKLCGENIVSECGCSNGSLNFQCTETEWPESKIIWVSLSAGLVVSCLLSCCLFISCLYCWREKSLTTAKSKAGQHQTDRQMNPIVIVPPLSMGMQHHRSPRRSPRSPRSPRRYHLNLSSPGRYISDKGVADDDPPNSARQNRSGSWILPQGENHYGSMPSPISPEVRNSTEYNMDSLPFE